MKNFTKQSFYELTEQIDKDLHNIDVNKVSDFYIKQIDAKDINELRRAFGALYGDSFLTCPTYMFAKNMAKSGQNVYFYLWTYSSKWMARFGCDEQIICHGADIVFTFGEPLVNQTLFTETDYDFSLDVMQMWTTFAKNG